MSETRERMPLLSAEEYEALAAKPLHTADQFHRYTGIGINRVHDLMRDGTLPVFPSPRNGGDLIVVRLALRALGRTALTESKRRAAS
jgi:hypothetical protein